MAFGISGDTKKSQMVGADVAIGWLDQSTGKGFVHDHFIDARRPCSGANGVCQDTLSSVNILHQLENPPINNGPWFLERR